MTDSSGVFMILQIKNRLSKDPIRFNFVVVQKFQRITSNGLLGVQRFGFNSTIFYEASHVKLEFT